MTKTTAVTDTLKYKVAPAMQSSHIDWRYILQHELRANSKEMIAVSFTQNCHALRVRDCLSFGLDLKAQYLTFDRSDCDGEASYPTAR